MSLLFWGLTISVIGKVLIAYAVIMAHSELEHEHRIDEKVIRTFHRERAMTIFGIVLIIVGYGLEIYFYEFATSFMSMGMHESVAPTPAP